MKQLRMHGAGITLWDRYWSNHRRISFFGAISDSVTCTGPKVSTHNPFTALVLPKRKATYDYAPLVVKRAANSNWTIIPIQTENPCPIKKTHLDVQGNELVHDNALPLQIQSPSSPRLAFSIAFMPPKASVKKKRWKNNSFQP
uniref:Uncharacterized protein n=1 Tax=Oryza punctata TaxID=4537 RepID=A0A0E0ML23_ORYPU